MTKFADGPWHVVSVGNEHFVSSNDGELLSINTGDHGVGRDVDAANAHLVAAAPEMYEALKQAEEWLFGWKSAVPQLAVIQAALARAEGEQ